MSQIARAYKEFLKKQEKRNAKMKSRMTASSGGLLARRNKPMSASTGNDQMDMINNIVDEIRKYGGRPNGEA